MSLIPHIVAAGLIATLNPLAYINSSKPKRRTHQVDPYKHYSVNIVDVIGSNNNDKLAKILSGAWWSNKLTSMQWENKKSGLLPLLSVCSIDRCVISLGKREQSDLFECEVSPLVYAIYCDNLKAVELLLEYGAPCKDIVILKARVKNKQKFHNSLSTQELNLILLESMSLTEFMQVLPKLAKHYNWTLHNVEAMQQLIDDYATGKKRSTKKLGHSFVPKG